VDSALETAIGTTDDAAVGEGGSAPRGESASATGRAARQRARILEAAERCFIERGFHAASMASIAATAGMSAGLIYRYFAGKNEIVRAIVQRHMETDGCPATCRLQKPEDFCSEALAMFERWKRRDTPSMNAALLLELTAEAARDPEIAQIVRDKDQLIARDLTQIVQRLAREQGARLSPNAAYTRAVILQCVVEGLACRAVRDPQLSAQTLKPLLGKLIAAMLG
jgi:AcrR family transcriptional regulator